MSKTKKYITYLLCNLSVMFGLAFLVQNIWEQLELLYYGKINNNPIDTIVGLVLVISLYYNVCHYITTNIKEFEKEQMMNKKITNINKKTIVFDFDGVIHSYTSGWKGYDVIPDEPVEGIKEVIDELRNQYEIVVVSSRCKTDEGIKAIKDYLNKYNIVVDRIMKEKPPAILYIDDRAICFDGDCKNLLNQINNFKTWQEKLK